MTSMLRALSLLLIVLLFLPQMACTPRTTGGVQREHLEPAREAELESRHAAIVDAYRQGAVEDARALSVALLEEVPGYHAAPNLRRRLAESYAREARWDLVLHHVGRLLEDYPDSNECWPAHLLKARALAETGRRLDSATGLDRMLESWPEGSWLERARTYLISLIDRGLNAADLEEFLRRRPRSVQAGQARLVLAERYLLESRREEARSLLETVAADPEQNRYREVARERLTEMGIGDIGLAPEEAVAEREGVIGVLAPLSGRYSVYGEAFLDGARLALARYNSEQLSRFEMVAGDTGGEPVNAALTSRRLILQEGVSVLLGGVLSNPTVAAAIESNARQVPLLSPSATAEDIHEIGSWVFQNNITSEAQVLSLARLAVHELLSSRFAILYPKQGNGENLATLFANTVHTLGGEVVANVAYDIGVTDFSDVMIQIRDAQPEVIFIPGQVEQLVLIVPQLAYHGIYGQLLGNEAWNSRRLARLAGARAGGAIFPSDVLLKRDRELYQEFLQLYERRYSSNVNPIAARSFLGMTTLLEIMGDGALDRKELRNQLALRMADLGDEDLRREILSEQVTLMTIRDGEIQPYGSTDFFEPESGTDRFIDGPWKP
ncbi:MAG: ABC transporter substrate-binding protein [bacterium]|nr:ABC transporter substrate-binding protein [bacterium]